MHRFLYLLTFVLIFGLVQTTEARKLALLVGVDEYIKAPSLKCCVNDMKNLKKALMKIGFEEDDIQVLVTGGAYRNFPTKKNIERHISQIVINAQPTDMVFLAFSGHGAQDGKNVYFCPPDVETDDLKGSCVSINKVMDILANKCKAKFKWMVVDACRNDPTQGAKGIGGKGLQVIPTPPAGIALFQSCAEGEESWEDHNSGNGYFTKNFAAALSGAGDSNHDGKLTLMEVCSWTTAHTKEQVMKSQNKSQRPYFSGTVSDFTLYEDLNLAKAKVIVEQARKAVKEENYALAIKKFDEALALYPYSNQLKHERSLAQRFLDSKPTANPMKISVPDDCKTIEEAYAKVKDGGIITIEPGKYELSATLVVNRSVTFRGGGAKGDDVIISHVASHTFKITGGSPLFQNLTVTSGVQVVKEKDYNCFYVTEGTPKLVNCTMSSLFGAGIYVEGEKANPHVESCIVKGCKDGIVVCNKGLGEFRNCELCNNMQGIYLETSGNPTFVECKIHDGRGMGVFVENEGLGTFNNCEIYKNMLPGILVETSGNPTFTDCKIYDGGISTGVSVEKKGLGKFHRCDIYGNGGGVSVESSGNPIFTTCQIHDSKEFRSGVDVSKKGLGEFRNCDIYGNGQEGVEVKDFGNPTFIDCKIHDNKSHGVHIEDAGMGTFKNNKLSNNNDFVGKLSNWKIESDAGKVTGSGNTPPIPEQ